VIDGWDIDATHVAVNANHGGQARRQMQIGSSVLHAECEKLTNIHSLFLVLARDNPGTGPGCR
jgi:hypothetical protein